MAWPYENDIVKKLYDDCLIALMRVVMNMLMLIIVLVAVAYLTLN